MSKRKDQKTRLFDHLKRGKSLTVREARMRLQIKNPSAVVNQLRDEGARIFSQFVYRQFALGRPIVAYRLDLENPWI